MILSLTALLTTIYSTASATPLLAQSNNCNLQGSNILFDYVSTELGIHKIHADGASWNGARNICQQEGARLAIIDTAAEEAMLMKHMKANNLGSVWIGVHDLFEKKQWNTITGQRLYSLEYVRWARGEPNGLGAGERCVEMNMGGMNDLACETEMAFACEKPGIDIRIGNK